MPATTVPIGSSGGHVTLQAILKRAIGNVALSGKILEFKVDGVSIGQATTNSSGVAFMIHSVPATTSLGAHTMTVLFAGDTRYKPSSRNGILTVESATP